MNNQPSYKLSDFKKIKTLGNGQYGVVHLGEYKGDKNLKVAIKECQTSIHDNKKKYLIREVAALASLNHPNINKLYGYEVDKNEAKLYLFLEYCNGGDLQKALETYKAKHNKPFPEELCQHLLKQIALGLQAMHNLNFVHRDLKPGNFILHYENEQDQREMNLFKAKVKIADLGFARYLDSNELTESKVGTPYFADPRIFLIHNERYGKEVDVWSFGIISFQLLTGTLPFQARDFADLGDKIHVGNFVIPSEVKLSEESVSFIQCALVENTHIRWEINDLVRHFFFAKKVNEFRTLLNKRKDEDGEVKLNIYNLEESLVTKNNLMDISIFKQQPQKRTDLPYDKVSANLGMLLSPNSTCDLMEQQERNEEMAKKTKMKQQQQQQYEQRSTSTKEESEINITEDIEKKLKKCFMEMNEDFLYFRPKIAPSFPYLPEEAKELQLDVRIIDNFN